MFEVTGHHVAKLTDGDLRNLVALLCQAELRRRNLPVTSVTYGGDQDAADGGIDVRVMLDASSTLFPPIPRSSTGYQVKAETMSRSRILAEMRPKGVLRDVIRKLALSAGAYIIASSKDSATDLSLGNRLKAMREAVADLPNASSLHLDFFDRTRLATWVRDHAGMVIWVRAKIGEPIRGWHPYESWTLTPDTVDKFLIDEALRFKTPDSSGESLLTVSDGFAKIRATLSQARGVVRFVGLSGVGKTRLAQALFESDIAGDVLDQSTAVYTNLGDAPDPTPIAMATELVALGQRAILVVDNCPADLHASLSDICRRPSSSVSLLTIEYDIRDDQPEGTEIFEIQPSSQELIQTLLQKRYPQLSKVDAQRAAEFSGGNARVAIAIAGTAEKKDSIAELNDDVLFRRLFEQRKGADDSLLLSAHVCSLVYSFNVEDEFNGEAAELRVLGQIVERSFDLLYRDVELLRKRDLVQKRSIWRAILPHAIANRLAKSALEEIPPYKIDRFVNVAPPRMLVSLSRRLGYLHDSEQVKERVRTWLADGGLLNNLSTFGPDQVSMFKNVAPVAPELVLSAIERSIGAITDDRIAEICTPFKELLWSLAYESKYFERCVEVLVRMTLSSRRNLSYRNREDAISGLFPIYLSGTHATLAQRINVVEKLLVHSDVHRRDIGIAALDALLQTGHFISSHNFEFGARSRDFGYFPKTNAEVLDWYKSVLQLCVRIESTHSAVVPNLRKTLAEKLPSLWNSTDLSDEISDACLRIASRKFWPEGWLAVCSIRRWQKKEYTDQENQKIARLEASLRPVSLFDRTEAFLKRNAGSGYWNFIDEIDDETDYNAQIQKTEAAAYGLGKEIAADKNLLPDVARILVSTPSQMVFFSLTRGIIEASEDPQNIWDIFLSAFNQTPAEQRQVELLGNLLLHIRGRDKRFASKVLDAAVDDSVLAEWFPVLQSRSGLDSKGLARIKKSLRAGTAPIGRYLALSTSPISIAPRDVRSIAAAIRKRKEGFGVALQTIWMLVARAKQDKTTIPNEAIEACRDLLNQVDWNSSDHMFDYHLADLSEVCLDGDEGATLARKICASFNAASRKHQAGTYNHERLFSTLLAIQPLATLDGLLLTKKVTASRLIRNRFDESNGTILENAPQATLLAWCNVDPGTRFPLLAAAITPFRGADELGKRSWTALAMSLLDHAPDKVQVLREYVAKFVPMSWSGSRWAIIETNLRLLDDLKSNFEGSVHDFILMQRERLLREIEFDKEWELSRSRAKDERFE
ncbi:MAG TPA: hypothetical protein VN622_00725 [Clostridia bacterium]|nr:hypothetical protein [Clostridia bacterium]